MTSEEMERKKEKKRRKRWERELECGEIGIRVESNGRNKGQRGLGESREVRSVSKKWRTEYVEMEKELRAKGERKREKTRKEKHLKGSEWQEKEETLRLTQEEGENGTDSAYGSAAGKFGAEAISRAFGR